MYPRDQACTKYAYTEEPKNYMIRTYCGLVRASGVRRIDGAVHGLVGLINVRRVRFPARFKDACFKG